MSESTPSRSAGRRKPAARALRGPKLRPHGRGRTEPGRPAVTGALHDVVLAPGEAVVLNRRGQEAERIPASRLKNRFGEAMRKALTNGAVTIVKHNEAQAVLLSLDQYQALAAHAPQPLQALSAEFDALVAQMQGAGPRKAARALFTASPAEFGKAALAAAKRRG